MREYRKSRPMSVRAAIGIAAAVAMALPLIVGPSARAGVRATVEQYRSGEEDITIECFTPTKGGTWPAVLLLHGSGGLDEATGAVFRGIAKKLVDKGFVALIPHYFDRTQHQVGEPLRKGEYEEMAEAMSDAVAYAAARQGVDPERIGLFGFSMGAGWAFSHASRDPRIKAIVSLSGPTHPRMAKAKLPPVLILNGAKDQGPPETGAEAFAAALEEAGIPHDLHLYPGVGHNPPMTLFSDIGRRTASFFAAHLKADDDTQPADEVAKDEAPKPAGARAETLMRMAKSLERSNPSAAVGYYRDVVEKFPGTSEATAASERIASLEKKP